MTAYRFTITETLKHLVLILGAIVVALPFYVMLSSSLKSPGEIERNEGGFFGSQALMVDEYCMKRGEPEGFANGNVSSETALANLRESCSKRPALFNYATAFSEAPLLRYLLNGVIVTASIFLLQVLVAVPAAYALSKLRFWGRDMVFSCLLYTSPSPRDS